jgi:hypothetical protein
VFELSFVYWHPKVASQLSSVQALESSQASGFEPTQTPAAQVSVWVQTLPSEQVFELSFVYTHPVNASQLSSVQALESSQVIGFEPTQTPAAQVSVWVQTLPSEQVFKSSFVYTHPSAASQLSSVQSLPSLQVIGFEPTQTPAAQVSVWVQTLPSEQVFELSFVY